MSDLLKLAERVEALNGPCVEIFEDAWAAIFPKPSRIWEDEDREEWTAEYSNWNEAQRQFWDHIYAGAFLEAAVTLVPQGWDWSVSSEQGYGVAYCIDKGIFGHDTTARTPALALTAAALRARAAQEQQP